LSTYSVESELTNEEIGTKIINTNIDDEQLVEKALTETKVKFRTGPKGKRVCHAVVEVSPEVRKVLLERPRIY